MTEAQKKAKELIDKYISIDVVLLGCGKEEGNPCVISDKMQLNSAKQCALICVDEIIKCTHSDKRANSILDKEFWQEVKQEIINYK